MISVAASADAPFSTAADPEEQPAPWERWTALAFLGVGLLLRLLYAWHYRIDSDEPQHLHVVWAWTRGLLPYRDVFDNHSPLFQALYAPLFFLLGVRPDILLPMRLAELPLYVATIWAVWKIAHTFYAPRIALWTTVLAALCPPLGFSDGFYLSSIEFRPDQLWALLWLLILMILAVGRSTPGRAFLAGVLCGVAFAVSMKTTLLLAALLLSLFGASLVRWASGGLDLGWWRLLRCAGTAILGIPLVPVLVVGYFWSHGALQELHYCVITHNILPDPQAHGLGGGAIKDCLFGLGAAVAGGYVISRLDKSISVRTRIGFIYLAGVFYITLLRAFWPVITEEDYLPFHPAMMLTIGPALLYVAGLALRGPQFVGVIFAGAELIAILVSVSPFQDETADKTGMVADTLRLTSPDEFVMDSKGETIYRKRPFRYVIESRTFHRMKMKLIQDDVADRLIETRAPLAASTFRMPHDARDFIKRNYVPIAFRLRVLGQVLRKDSEPAHKPCHFQISVPERYTLVTAKGSPSGQLDGAPFTGPRELVAGAHLFVPDDNSGEVILVWAKALERGYSPFAKIKEDHVTAQD